MAEKTDKNQEIVLKDVRLSFVNLFSPQEFTDEITGNKRYTYNANLLLPKKLADGSPNPQVKILSDAMKAAIEATWTSGKDGKAKMIPPERRCVRDGEPIDPDTVDSDVPGSGTRVPLYEGYAGHFFVSANRSVKGPDAPNPVQLLDSRKGPNGKFPRLRESDGKLYSGCYVDAIIRIYGYDGKGKNPDRVNASLEAVKFKRHGEAFGAKPVDADSLFDDEGPEDGFDTPDSGADDDLLG